MALTAEALVAAHPEFTAIAASHPGVVSTAIADAAAETDASVCGAETDRVVRLKACDLIARSPFGAQANLVDEDGITPYSRTLEQVVSRIGLTHRTVLE